MTSYIRLVPLSGARNEQGVCTLLELDEAKILLDCGWSDDLALEDLELLKKYARDIDYVLLSHGSVRHCGALAYAMTKLQMNCPVYATFPVQSMGRLSVMDAWMTRRMHVDFDKFSRKDIEFAFNRITLLRYSQPHLLSGKGQGTMLTAFAAGHSVGGTIWKLKKDTEEIVYALDINHRKEAHLAPTALFTGDQVASGLSRPSVLLAGSRLPFSSSVRGREDALIQPALKTLQKGGTVLVPVDAATRVLEIAYVLEERWKAKNLSFPVVLLSHAAHKVMHSARGMLEWYAEALTKMFANKRVYPFDFSCVKLAATWQELQQFSRPKLVLATNETLHSGFALDQFLEICEDPKNLIVLPCRARVGTLSRHIFDAVHRSSTPTDVVSLDEVYAMTRHRRVFLEGEELEEYMAERSRADEMAREQADLMARNKSIMDADVSDEDEDEPIMPGEEASKRRPAHQAQFVGFDAFVHDQPLAKFHFVEHRRRYDEYGEVIKPEHFMTDSDRIEKERERAARRRQEAEDQVNNDTVDDAAMDAIESKPCKYVTEEAAVRIKCRAKVVDFEGISDLDSLARILPMVQARHIVFVGGSSGHSDRIVRALGGEMKGDSEEQRATPDSTIEPFGIEADDEILFERSSSIDEGSKSDAPDSIGADEMNVAEGEADETPASEPEPSVPAASQRRIVAPCVGEAVDLSSTKNVVQVKLTDALFTNIAMHKYGDYEIGLVSGSVKVPSESTVPILDALEVTSMTRHPPVVVGVVRLSDFKSILEAKGYHTEFVKGILMINRKIGVGKNARGELMLEGRVCPEYYQVRKLLYQQLVVL